MERNSYMKVSATTRIWIKSILVCLLLAQSGSVFARQPFRQKVINLKFNSARMVTLYGGTRNIVRVIEIPREIDRMIMYISAMNKSGTKTIGKPMQDVQRGPNGSFIDFKIHAGTLPSTETERIYFKAFSKKAHENSYEIKNDYMIRAFVINCLNIYTPVCAQPIVPDCKHNDTECLESTPGPKTYKNLCEARKEEAEYLYRGECY